MRSQGPTEIKRATTEKLREVFQKYASQQRNGEHFMTSEDFIRGYLGLFPEENFNKVSRVDIPIIIPEWVANLCVYFNSRIP